MFNVIFLISFLTKNWSYFPSPGESGLGKSTLINSLFLTDLYKDRKVPNAEGEIWKHKLSQTFFSQNVSAVFRKRWGK